MIIFTLAKEFNSNLDALIELSQKLADRKGLFAF